MPHQGHVLWLLTYHNAGCDWSPNDPEVSGSWVSVPASEVLRETKRVTIVRKHGNEESNRMLVEGPYLWAVQVFMACSKNSFSFTDITNFYISQVQIKMQLSEFLVDFGKKGSLFGVMVVNMDSS